MPRRESDTMGERSSATIRNVVISSWLYYAPRKRKRKRRMWYVAKVPYERYNSER